MLRYPAKFKPAKEGGFAVRFRDIAEAITQRGSVEDAMIRARDPLETALDFYFDDCREGQENEMNDRAIRTALDRHWAASDASEFEAEHEIYREDAVLDYPQSGERIRGRQKIRESRIAQPNKKRFAVRRIIGTGDLWITEFVLSYDAVPSYVVSIMEFIGGKVAHETQYFCDPFEPGLSRAHLVEMID
jgi:predicted RNase H-like HicB family nuclease